MTQPVSDRERDQNGDHQLASVAEELKRESDRLRQLADQLKAQEEAQAEMRENYQRFQRAVYALLREKFERELPPLPDRDLETLAAEEAALPLEAFIAELEQEPEPGGSDA